MRTFMMNLGRTSQNKTPTTPFEVDQLQNEDSLLFIAD